MKKILIFAAVLGLFVSCSKEGSEKVGIHDQDITTSIAEIITVTADATVTGQSYYSSDVSFGLDSLKIFGSEYEFRLKVNSGKSVSLSPGGKYSWKLFPQTYIAVDTPEKMIFNLNFTEIDNPEVGSEITVTVKDKSGKILGQTKMRYYEASWNSDDIDDVVVNLSGNENVKDYFVSFDVVFIPTYVFPSTITSDYTIINNTSSTQAFEFEPGHFTLFYGIYEIPTDDFIGNGKYDITVSANGRYTGHILVDYDFYILSYSFQNLQQVGLFIGNIYNKSIVVTLTGDNNVLLDVQTVNLYVSPVFSFNLHEYPIQKNYKISYTITIN